MAWSFARRAISSDRIRLETLEAKHLPQICESLLPDPDGWYSRMFGLNTEQAYREEIEQSEKLRSRREGMGFALILPGEDLIAGISFFLRADEENRSIEIGTTNIAPRFRRTFVNTAAKYVMLRDAFESLDCIRVSFRVDVENTISQRAVERLGAVPGGILRYERILPDGRKRDYRFNSIVDHEWPAVKRHLLRQLER